MKYLCVLLLILFGCKSSDSDDGIPCVGCVGSGSVVLAQNSKLEVSFDSSQEGQRFLIVPYDLGDLATVAGAPSSGAGEALTASVAGSENSATLGLAAPPTSKALSTNHSGYQHQLRTLMNHFDSRKSIKEQSSGFFELASRMDQQRSAGLSFQAGGEDSLVEAYQKAIKQQRGRWLKDRPVRMNGGACPEEIYTPASVDPLSAADYTSDNKTNFCLVVIKDGSLVSEPSQDAIKDSIATAIATYKLIYEDSFEVTRDEYAFKPLIITVPIDDANFWPQNSAYQIQGAFQGEATDWHGRPTIYVAADLRVVGTSEEDQKEAFHSLIAHELQHAIANYYRTWVPEQVAEEVPSIDEGLAHLMEDVLGYGQMNFALFAKPYLATAALAPEPVLYDKSLASLSDSARGAAHAIFYYLTSSLGGITYKDGAVDRTSGGSPGLNWIKAYMQAAVGAAGLNAATAGQWMSKVGGFFGALMVDAADSFEAAPEFSVMAPIQGVIDTSGQTGKVFGMRFHAFEGLPQVSESLENLSELQVGQLYKGTLRLYEPEPLLFDVPSGGDVVSIAVSGASTNIGAAVIRIY